VVSSSTPTSLRSRTLAVFLTADASDLSDGSDASNVSYWSDVSDVSGATDVHDAPYESARLDACVIHS
jgi:hypothetical protein